MKAEGISDERMFFAKCAMAGFAGMVLNLHVGLDREITATQPLPRTAYVFHGVVAAGLAVAFVMFCAFAMGRSQRPLPKPVCTLSYGGLVFGVIATLKYGDGRWLLVDGWVETCLVCLMLILAISLTTVSICFEESGRTEGEPPR